MVSVRMVSLSIVTLTILSAFTPDPTTYYKLKTEFLGDNKCIEGNHLGPTSTLKGAAFTGTCQNATGQSWKFVHMFHMPGTMP